MGARSWPVLLRHTPLGILTDLDGTLIPFTSTPEGPGPTPELRQLLAELAALPGVSVTVVSGRPREKLDRFFPAPRNVRLVAEHGAWRSSRERWDPLVADLELSGKRTVDSLVDELRRIQAKHPGTILEQKTWSVALHFRRVPTHEKPALFVELASVIGPWLEAHPDFERLRGVEMVEVRPRAARKRNAVTWVRELLGPKCRLVIAGDDQTDEDMFAAACEEDAAILVGALPDHSTKARWRLESPEDVHAFFRWIVAVRHDEGARPSAGAEPQPMSPPRDSSPSYRLLVLSNRLPELRSSDARKRNVGGLVSALRPVLATHAGIWLGWSGHTTATGAPSEVRFDDVGGLALAWIDIPEEWQRRYYNGLSNSALWPLFHSFPGRVSFKHKDWEAYEQANLAFAASATKLVGPDQTIWVHDYHLLLLAKHLRAKGHAGPIGLFQHIPFPNPDIFFLLPWATTVLEAMLEYDLVGFHTTRDRDNLLACVARMPGVRVEDARAIRGERVMNAGAFPLGIIPEEFQDTGDTEASEEVRGLMRAIGSSRLVLGVDRLDYTKGIPERIEAFGVLLEEFPSWRRNVSLVQVSVPSRADIRDYAEQRSRIENTVGRINGEFGEADWVPIRYLYRSYARKQLSELYRAADVGYVTPLRDGMNLVAKEFVAAQDPDRPGVLLLSRFAGAAEELSAALLTNPWYPEGTARDLDRAMRMPAEERLRRHTELLEVITKTTALTWAEDFLRALADVTGRVSAARR